MTVEPQLFRQTMAHWTSGVTVVTTIVDGVRSGITASSFASLSLQPPQILICVNKKLYTHTAIETSGAFAVNILGVEHLEWGMRFAGMRPELADRFEGIESHTAVTGAPIARCVTLMTVATIRFLLAKLWPQRRIALVRRFYITTAIGDSWPKAR